MVPQPLARELDAPEFVDSSGEGKGGSRNVWTCPEASPTAINGSVGWMAWEKRSEGSGYVQMVSNIAPGANSNCVALGIVG